MRSLAKATSCSRSRRRKPEIDRRRSNAIGIDASRATVAEKTGTETYTAELLKAIAALRPPDSFELYVNCTTPPAELPRLGEVVCLPFPRLWTHGRLSARMAAHPPGVLFVPAHVIPLIHPRSVVVVHDLGYLRYPDAHPSATRRMLDMTTRWNAKAARRIIAISETTKQDLIAAYRTPREKIDVVRHGVSPSFHPLSEPLVNETLDRLGVTRPYVLSVGTVQPRKNFGRLAAAMNRVAAAHLPHRLVIAGRRGWLADRVEREIAGSGQHERIDRLGYVAADDLPALYAGASAFCLPSLYEGFGMPVIEAMASGAPVVTSSSSALAEVAGDAAIIVDPTDVNEIGTALIRVLTDEALAKELRERGRRRAAEFTWEGCARTTLDILRAVRDA